LARATDSAYATLRQMILRGEAVAGSRLGEADLADTLGLSRTPVREALQRLEADGLVELLPHRGARVARWTPVDLAEIFELRGRLEPYGAARAARRGVPGAVLDELARLCEEMERAASDREHQAIAELNAAFHEEILRASGNSRLPAMVKTVVHVPIVIGTFRRYDTGALARSMGHHRELVAALRAGDPDWAEAVMTSHIRAAAGFLMEESR